MPTAETSQGLSEQEQVERWRAQELERAGYPASVATELSTRADVDLHRAIQLLGNGCPRLLQTFLVDCVDRFPADQAIKTPSHFLADAWPGRRITLLIDIKAGDR